MPLYNAHPNTNILAQSSTINITTLFNGVLLDPEEHYNITVSDINLPVGDGIPSNLTVLGGNTKKLFLNFDYGGGLIRIPDADDSDFNVKGFKIYLPGAPVDGSSVITEYNKIYIVPCIEDFTYLNYLRDAISSDELDAVKTYVGSISAGHYTWRNSCERYIDVKYYSIVPSQPNIGDNLIGNKVLTFTITGLSSGITKLAYFNLTSKKTR